MGIVILTLLAVAFIVLIIWLSYGLLAKMNVLYNDTEGKVFLKILLFIPYVLLAIWCLLIQIILVAITLGGAISLLNNTRDWWHKGK